MKKTLLMTFILALLGTGAVWAKPGHSVEKTLQHLTKALQLDATQQSQVAALMKVQQEKLQQLKEENRIAIEAVLSEQQKQKFVEMREKRKQKRQECKAARSEQ